MNKLYMISLGGKVEGANIEVHDVQFAVGESLEAVIPLVKESWYGSDFKLHMDSWKEIKGIEGHRIHISDEPSESEQELYFVYLGGYNEASTQEVHDTRLVLAGSEVKAKVKGRELEGFEHTQPHVDSVVRVEDVLLSADDKQYYIRLEASGEAYDMVPDWFGYKRLDV